MSALEDFTIPQLEEMSQKLAEEVDGAKARLKAVTRELAFKQNLAQRTKALDGLSPAEVARVLKLAQKVTPASIESAEAVGAKA